MSLAPGNLPWPSQTAQIPSPYHHCHKLHWAHFLWELTKILIAFLFEFRVYAFTSVSLAFSTCNEYLLNKLLQKRKINLIFPQESADDKQIMVMKLLNMDILCFILLRVLNLQRISLSCFLSCLSYMKAKASHIPTVLKSFEKQFTSHATIFSMKYYIPQI